MLVANYVVSGEVGTMKKFKTLLWILNSAFIFLPVIGHKQESEAGVRAVGAAGAGEGPEFERPIGNRTYHVGREAVLTCAVRNLGTHKVGWLRHEDQTVLSLGSRAVLGGRYSAQLDPPSTWLLRIRPLKLEDRGCYMCQLNTRPTMTYQIGCIDIYVPPDIVVSASSSEVSVAEGDNATLVCRATGHPPPRVTWRREHNDSLLLRRPGPTSRELHKVEGVTGEVITLWRVDRRQMGALLCIASNDVPPSVSKRVTLNVNFPPTVKVPNQLLGAPLGTDVTLECYVEAFPNTINYWVKNRGEMLLNGVKYGIREERSSYKVSMWLTIRHFSRQDIGTYNCISTNSLGKSEGTLRLYEIKLYPNSSENGSADEDIPEEEAGAPAPARAHAAAVRTGDLQLPPILIYALYLRTSKLVFNF